MAMPKSVTKLNKNGITYTSSVDRVSYTIKELTRAALRDVAKLVKRQMKSKINKDTGDTKKNVGSWVRKDKVTGKVWLQVGIYNRKKSKKKNKKPIVHAHILEFGSRFVRANPFLRPSVFDNLQQIQEIESKYLSAIEDELKAQSLINEKDEVS